VFVVPSVVCTLRVFFSATPRPPISTLFPYTTLFRSDVRATERVPLLDRADRVVRQPEQGDLGAVHEGGGSALDEEVSEQADGLRSEEHTSELQSRENLVCRLLLEKKKNTWRKKALIE